MSRQSVFDRLGPPNDDGSARLASEEVAAADTAAAPKQRVALAHPLVARQLQQVAGSRATAVDHSKPQPAAAQPLGQRQRRRRQQPGCSSSSEEHTQRQTSSSGVTGRRRRQPANPAHGNEQLQEEMQRLLAEREAAEEALGQMALQTQALLADRQALAAQAAQLASQKEQLEEQLEYLLQDQVGWVGRGGSGGPVATQSEWSGLGRRAGTPPWQQCLFRQHEAAAD